MISAALEPVAKCVVAAGFSQKLITVSAAEGTFSVGRDAHGHCERLRSARRGRGRRWSVFTTAATATWTVLVGDAAHWTATRIERRRLAMVLAGVLLGALVGALVLAHLRLWMPLLPALLTGGVALAAHRTIEDHADGARNTVSSAPHPGARAFGRSPDHLGATSHGH